MPGLVRWPAGGVGASARAELLEPLHFVDVLPTLAEAAGVPLPDDASERLHGASFLRLLRTPSARPADSSSALTVLARPFPLYWSSHSLPGSARKDGYCSQCDIARYAIRVGDWKLIAWAEPYACRETPMDYITGAKLLANGTRLYDLRADPAEAHDLASAQPERTAWLLRMLVRTRAAVQALGPRWNLDCQLPTGQSGVPIVRRPPLAGLCHCSVPNAMGRTIAERSAMADAIRLSRSAPRPLLVLAPPLSGAELVLSALSAHPLVVGMDAELLSVESGATNASQRRGAAASPAPQLFGGKPLCAFEFPLQLGARANASARATQAVLVIMHGGLLLSSIKLDRQPAARARGMAARVSLRTSAEEVLGPIHASGAPCFADAASAARAQRRHAPLATAMLALSARPLVKALAAAGTIALQVVRRDRKAHWCELTAGVASAQRAARCGAPDLARIHRQPAVPAVRAHKGWTLWAKRRLLSGRSVYRQLLAGAAEGELHLSAARFAVAADAEDAAAGELLRAAGVIVASVALEDIPAIVSSGQGLEALAASAAADPGLRSLLCVDLFRQLALSGSPASSAALSLPLACS